MDLGRTLKYVSREDRGNAWTLKVSQDSCGHFGINGVSLGKHFISSKASQTGEFLESKEIKSDFRRTLEMPKKKKKSVLELERPSSESSCESIQNIESSRNSTKIKGTFSGSKDGRSGSLQTAKQKTYLRLVLGRSSQANPRRNGNIDEDYISLDDALVSCYFREESEIEHSTGTLRSGRAAQSAELRSGVKSGKCRLRRKYDDVSVVQSDNSLVRYGK